MTGDAAVPPAKAMVVCIHEDRPANLPGVQLAILSLARHAPWLRAVVHCPGSDEAFRRFVDSQPNAAIVDLPGIESNGWNVKPALLLRVLETHEEVIWLDSDIIVAGDLQAFFSPLSVDTLVACEETYWGQAQGSRIRTQHWGLSFGRAFRCTVNSGVIRVTRSHAELLSAWKKMLAHPTYLLSQTRPWYERPVHMIGDQEALTGLLGSSDFMHLPVVLLRRGRDIAQCFGPAGFTPVERIRALFGRAPAFIHAMGPKPWSRAVFPPSLLDRSAPLKALRKWYEYRSLDVSPYCIEAKSYKGRSDVDVDWAWPRSWLGKALTALGGRRPPLPGLPLAVFDHAARRAKRALRIGRYSSNPDFTLHQPPY